MGAAGCGWATSKFEENTYDAGPSQRGRSHRTRRFRALVISWTVPAPQASKVEGTQIAAQQPVAQRRQALHAPASKRAGSSGNDALEQGQQGWIIIDSLQPYSREERDTSRFQP